jgi:hypothetical protein
MPRVANGGVVTPPGASNQASNSPSRRHYRVRGRHRYAQKGTSPMKATTNINPDFFDVKGASAYLGGTVSKSTLDKMRIRGDGPQYLKVGQKVIYTKQHLDRFIAKRTQTSTAQNKPRAAGDAI